MGKQKAPPPPDYAAAAKEQGEANVAAAQMTAGLNRPEQHDPNGSQTWTMKPGADPKNPKPGDWIVKNTLNETQQGLKDQQDALSGQFGTLAQKSLDTVGNTMATKFDTSPMGEVEKISADVSKQQAPAVPTDRQDINANGLQNYGQVDPTTEASRQKITDALYNRQTAMLDPQTKQQTSDLTARLAAQGITEGSEAYNRAVDNQARQQAQAYQGARDSAILAGGAEDSRIGQQNLNVAGFQNATRGQQLGERTDIAGFNNANRDTTFNQGLAAGGFNNQIKDAQFNMDQVAAGFNNTARQNQVAEALMLRQLPMNEANALRTGNQVGGMNFQAYGGGGQIAAAPTYQATGDRYKAEQDAVNTSNANSAAMMKGITSMGSMFMGSDRRLKKDIVQVGMHKVGVPLYDFTYIASGDRMRGVMADELREVMPAAVMRGTDGFDRVNYHMLG